jgi:membrane protein DedA with SNARE-associated domain
MRTVPDEKDPEEEKKKPPLPTLPPIGRRDVACVGPLVVLGIYRLVNPVLNGPLLGSNPVLLSALRGSFPSMIFAGSFVRAGIVPLWLALLAPIPVLMSDDPFVYWAGRRYGRPLLNHLVEHSPQWRKQLPRAERVFARFRVSAIIVGNLPVNPLPMITVVMFLAGETRMKFLLFIVVDFISLLIVTSFWVGLGAWIGKPAQNIAQTISHFALPITLVTLAIIVVLVWRSTRNTMRQMREQYGDDWYNQTGEE